VEEKPMSAITTTAANGQALLKVCNYDYRLCASIIVARPDEEQEELLSTIVVSDQRVNVGASLAAFRASLGLEPFSSGRQ
jgi:hypothetical protein